MLVRGSSAIYFKACSTAWRSPALFASAGSGTQLVTGTTIPGFVPHVTKGSSVDASISITRSNTAPSSLGNVLQWAKASFHAAPDGTNLRPLRYAKVVSSGA